MKKLFTLTLAIVLALSLFAACGGSNTPSGEDSTTPSVSSESTSAPAETATGAVAPTGGGSDADSGTVADFLELYGLTEDDIKPEGFIEFQEIETKDNPPKIHSIGYIRIAADKDTTGEAQIKVWYEKIYGKMQELSTDGKIYSNYITLDKESTLEALYENPLWEKFPGTMWAYPYKTSTDDVKLNVSTSYDYETGIYKMSISVFGG
ncbi:MAG: hypothetical protein LBN00_11350 [Oscillospiraceae bacterium]|jgi:hypothetical protein|nr:hypothetical protein [Oscillospiraceae bacterium]